MQSSQYAICRGRPAGLPLLHHAGGHNVGDHDGRFLTSIEAGEVLGLSDRTLARYRHTGRGPAYYKFGSLVRYRLQDIKVWASVQRVKKPRKKRQT